MGNAADPSSIRSAGPDEAGAVAALVRAAFAPFAPRIGREPAPMGADYPALCAQGAVHVAESGDRLAGAIVAYPKAGWLHVETVAAAAPRRGVGRALMGWAQAEAARLGLAGVELYTNAAMTEALAFYDALGFERLGRRREAGYERVYFRKEAGGCPETS